jgi:glycine hydroxymethyltransferase
MSEQVTARTGFLFDEELDQADPAVTRIAAFEEARQVAKLIMIASESAAPRPVRQALASVFTDLYAEGYPAAHVTHEPPGLIADIPYQIAYHERYGDRRYYKGTELADLVEALAQERIRELFAPNRYPFNPAQLGPDQLHANVQPLSGANANTAVYLALLQAGDTIMGLNLAQGGHLSHGSPVNISGKLFKVVPYGVNPATGRIDYDEVERLAQEHQPRMIVSGASAYPWSIDFVRLRKICDSLPRKAYLLADVSHPAGLVVAGLFPNPVGVADATTFTTHKTMIGPRAAVIITTNDSLARRIDRAVFPGLQGGPHMNTIAAMAVAFKLAQTPAFNDLQRTIVANAQALAETLQRRGLNLAYGGTETHLLLIDLRKLVQPSEVPLNGDVAARILDLAGVVCNKNAIFGDVSANYPSGIRLGTPWVTQRGLTPDDMRTLGGLIADVLQSIVTYAVFEPGEAGWRGKISPAALRRAQDGVTALVAARAVGPAEPAGWPGAYGPEPATLDGQRLLALTGRRVRAFLSEATDGGVWPLAPGQAVATRFLDADGQPVATVGLLRRPADQFGLDVFVCAVPPDQESNLTWWLRALSNGLVLFDPSDAWAKIDGPVAVSAFAGTLAAGETAALRAALAAGPGAPQLDQPYFVGQAALVARAVAPKVRPECQWPAASAVGEEASPLHFRWPASAEPAPDGWSLPRSYGDPIAELRALQSAAGLVDESALEVLEISGPDAARFLDLVTTNDVAFLAPNAAQYTFLLQPDGQFLADGLLYRTGGEQYWLTIAPSRGASVAHWLPEAAAGRCLIDREVPTRSLPNRLQVRSLRHSAEASARVVLGLVGLGAPAVLRALADTPEDRRKLGRLRRFTSVAARLAGLPVLVARTGHTALAQQYEIFVHPTMAVSFWDAALARGSEQGVRPVGWEAWHAAGLIGGLPWDEHTLGGRLAISPVQAGFGAEVQVHKPFFVGRRALLAEPYPPARQVIRFRVNTPDAELPRDGDPLLDGSGTCVGHVTGAPLLETEPVGLAFAEVASAPVGAHLTVLVGAGSRPPVPAGAPLPIGAQANPVVQVEVLPRFPR